MSVAEVTQVNSIAVSPIHPAKRGDPLHEVYPVSKFPGQLVRSLPTKPRLGGGTAVAVSRGKRINIVMY